MLQGVQRPQKWEPGLAAQVFSASKIPRPVVPPHDTQRRGKGIARAGFVAISFLHTHKKDGNRQKLKTGHFNFLPSVIICKLWQSQK